MVPAGRWSGTFKRESFARSWRPGDASVRAEQPPGFANSLPVFSRRMTLHVHRPGLLPKVLKYLLARPSLACSQVARRCAAGPGKGSITPWRSGDCSRRKGQRWLRVRWTGRHGHAVVFQSLSATGHWSFYRFGDRIRYAHIRSSHADRFGVHLRGEQHGPDAVDIARGWRVRNRCWRVHAACSHPGSERTGRTRRDQRARGT